jgi:Protein of unknown function (DUF3551)
MMIILQYARDAEHFQLLLGSTENSIAFFRRGWRDDPAHPTSIAGLKPSQIKQGERKMKQLLKLSAAPITALSALAFVAMATPASAGEYCRKDVTSAVVSCSFDTLAQCKDMSSGRGGDCFRDPFLPATSSAYAYQPKHLRSKKPVGKQ